MVGKSQPSSKKGKAKPSKVKPSKGRTSDKKKSESAGGYAWQAFTKKAVEFTRAARDLSRHVVETYGDNTSITQYEKFCVAASSMTPEERNIVHIEHVGVVLLTKYVAAKEARESERRSFRDEAPIGNVEGTLASLAASFQTSHTDESEKIGPARKTGPGEEESESMDDRY